MTRTPITVTSEGKPVLENTYLYSAMNPRTPIEVMADKACGAPDTSKAMAALDRIENLTDVLLKLANAAVAWSRNENDSEARLRAAVRAWVAAGG